MKKTHFNNDKKRKALRKNPQGFSKFCWATIGVWTIKNAPTEVGAKNADSVVAKQNKNEQSINHIHILLNLHFIKFIIWI